MKKSMHLFTIVLTIVFAALFASSAVAQTFIGDLSLSSQAEVDAFNYSEITGCLTIGGDDITDLGPFDALTSIGGYLSFEANPALLLVDGAFPSLTTLGRGIYFYNTHLVSFNGFDALLVAGDNIDFWFNLSLTSVSGFGALQTAGWSIEFGGNPVLTELPEFASLQSISSSLYILDNLSLASITGFNALQDVDWSFQINNNSSLNNLCGFYDYFTANNPYTGGGTVSIDENSPDLPNSATIQDILDAGPCDTTSVGDSPQLLLEQLTADVNEMQLSKSVHNKLVKALAKVQNSLNAGKLVTATNQLLDLVDAIDFQLQHKKINAPIADELTAAVVKIIDSVNS